METVSRAVAGGAIALSWVVFALLCLAVLGAMVEAGRPGTDMRVRTALRSSLTVALRAFLLVVVALVGLVVLALVMAVALARLVVRPVPTRKVNQAGRHRSPGRGHRWQDSGAHRV